MTKSKIFIHWFRQDLRIHDNPSLYSCAKQGLVLPIYILDDENSEEFKMGRGSRYFLHYSLKSLNKSLEGNLRVFKGDALKVLKNLIENHDIAAVQWNRCYEPWRLKRDKKIQKMLKEKKIDFQDFNGSLLFEPWDIAKNDGNPYKVFTPFYKNGCLQGKQPQEPLSAPENIQFFTTKIKNTIDLKQILPDQEFCKTMDQAKWKIGEDAALKKLNKFIESKIQKYSKGRDYPSMNKVSKLSPHVHFGELSPHQIWNKLKKISSDGKEKFKQELVWRDFQYYLLYHFPNITTENYQKKFDDYPWESKGEKLEKWKKGLTGYPMVDAAMRELNQTGYMHNRCRMIVASFLVKNLNIHWKEGERYFWDYLFDADLASNCASWQWVAGSGLDAAPFFRVFNVVTQGKKFDGDGIYIYKYCPELKNLSTKYLHDPTNAPEKELKKANIELGKDYPKALVDISKTREYALKEFKKITEKHKKNK